MNIQWKEKQTPSGEMAKIPVFLMHEDEYQDLAADMFGLCLACGEEAHCIEPDAVQYRCESCGLNKVYGVENALLLGRIKIEGEHDNE
jgi:hypothetical protein